MSDLSAILGITSGIARDAGALLRQHYEHPHQIETKTSSMNLVTQADRASEKAIVEALRATYPDHGIVGEEGSNIEARSEFAWLVDPLDGTTNFAHSYPFFCVSMCLQDQSGPLVGVVYDPLRDEMFSAIRGRGATLNDHPVHMAQATALDQALLVTGFPYDSHTAEDNNHEALGLFLRQAQGLRRSGSAALDLCYVACGRADGFWERGINAWDMAAGLLLVREAGGRATTYQGVEEAQAIFDTKSIVASNPALHPAMLETLQKIYPSA
jgi:myo-inositol-1(or 4)-monophosphatase